MGNKKKKQKDFQKVKLRVGRKLQRVNETRISLSTRKLQLVQQSLGCNENKAAEEVSFFEIGKKLAYSQQASDHLLGLEQVCNWLQINSINLPVGLTPDAVLHYILPHCRNCRDARLRRAACATYLSLVTRLAACSDSRAFWTALRSAPLTTLNHVDAAVCNEGPALLYHLCVTLPDAVVDDCDAIKEFGIALSRYRDRLEQDGGASVATSSIVNRLLEACLELLACFLGKISNGQRQIQNAFDESDWLEAYWADVNFQEESSSILDEPELSVFIDSTLMWCAQLWQTALTQQTMDSQRYQFDSTGLGESLYSPPNCIKSSSSSSSSSRRLPTM